MISLFVLLLGLGSACLGILGLKRGEIIAVWTYRKPEDLEKDAADFRHYNRNAPKRGIYVGLAARWMSYGYGSAGAIMIASALLTQDESVLGTVCFVGLILVGAANHTAQLIS